MPPGPRLRRRLLVVLLFLPAVVQRNVVGCRLSDLLCGHGYTISGVPGTALAGILSLLPGAFGTRAGGRCFPGTVPAAIVIAGLDVLPFVGEGISFPSRVRQHAVTPPGCVWGAALAACPVAVGVLKVTVLQGTTGV